VPFAGALPVGVAPCFKCPHPRTLEPFRPLSLHAPASLTHARRDLALGPTLRLSSTTPGPCPDRFCCPPPAARLGTVLGLGLQPQATTTPTQQQGPTSSLAFTRPVGLPLETAPAAALRKDNDAALRPPDILTPQNNNGLLHRAPAPAAAQRRPGTAPATAPASWPETLTPRRAPSLPLLGRARAAAALLACVRRGPRSDRPRWPNRPCTRASTPPPFPLQSAPPASQPPPSDLTAPAGRPLGPRLPSQQHAPAPVTQPWTRRLGTAPARRSAAEPAAPRPPPSPAPHPSRAVASARPAATWRPCRTAAPLGRLAKAAMPTLPTRMHPPVPMKPHSPHPRACPPLAAAVRPAEGLAAPGRTRCLPSDRLPSVLWRAPHAGACPKHHAPHARSRAPPPCSLLPVAWAASPLGHAAPLRTWYYARGHPRHGSFPRAPSLAHLVPPHPCAPAPAPPPPPRPPRPAAAGGELGRGRSLGAHAQTTEHCLG
jgi:hypothetical protein